MDARGYIINRNCITQARSAVLLPSSSDIVEDWCSGYRSPRIMVDDVCLIGQHLSIFRIIFGRSYLDFAASSSMILEGAVRQQMGHALRSSRRRLSGLNVLPDHERLMGSEAVRFSRSFKHAHPIMISHAYAFLPPLARYKALLLDRSRAPTLLLTTAQPWSSVSNYARYASDVGRITGFRRPCISRIPMVYVPA